MSLNRSSFGVAMAFGMLLSAHSVSATQSISARTDVIAEYRIPSSDRYNCTAVTESLSESPADTARDVTHDQFVVNLTSKHQLTIVGPSAPTSMTPDPAPYQSAGRVTMSTYAKGRAVIRYHRTTPANPLVLGQAQARTYDEYIEIGTAPRGKKDKFLAVVSFRTKNLHRPHWSRNYYCQR